MSETIPQLHMRRILDDLPALQLPDGYGLRTLRREDAAAWAALLDANGELGAWNEERATPYFASTSPMPLAGSFVATMNGLPVATAQLHVHPDDEYAPLAELGWVAVRPEHRGRRLGSAVCLAVMHYAKATGYRELFLRTDDGRLPAIGLYLRLGWQPWMRDASSPDRWRHILAKLSPKPS
jgi:mycothiol synthase